MEEEKKRIEQLRKDADIKERQRRSLAAASNEPVRGIGGFATPEQNNNKARTESAIPATMTQSRIQSVRPGQDFNQQQ